MIRLLPYLPCEKKKLEAYFEAKAAKGWYFSWSMGSLIGFYRGTPQACNYEIRYRKVPSSHESLLNKNALREYIFVYCHPKESDDGVREKFDEEELMKQMYRDAKWEIGAISIGIILLLLWCITKGTRLQASAADLGDWYRNVSVFVIPGLIFLFAELTRAVRKLLVLHKGKEFKRITALYFARVFVVVLFITQFLLSVFPTPVASSEQNVYRIYHAATAQFQPTAKTSALQGHHTVLQPLSCAYWTDMYALDNGEPYIYMEYCKTLLPVMASKLYDCGTQEEADSTFAQSGKMKYCIQKREVCDVFILCCKREFVYIAMYNLPDGQSEEIVQRVIDLYQ